MTISENQSSLDAGLILDQYDDMLDIDWWTPGNPQLMERQLRDEAEKHFRRNFTGHYQYMVDQQLEIEKVRAAGDGLRRARIESEREQLRERQRRDVILLKKGVRAGQEPFQPVPKPVRRTPGPKLRRGPSRGS